MAALIAVWAFYPRRQMERAAEPGVTEIAFMGPGGPIAGAMDDAVRAFEADSRAAHAASPAAPVYRVVSGQNAARDQVSDPTRFLVSVAGGEPPDVIFFDRFAVAEWAARGAFLPLDPFIAADRISGRPDQVTPDAFYASCWDEARYQGKVYGIPNSVDDRALLYNKDLLKRAGLVDARGEAKPPRDWDELKAYAIRLTEHDATGHLSVVGFAPQYGNSWLYIYGWMAGGEFMSADGRRCTLNDPRIAEALGYMTDVYDALGGYAAVDAFQAGFQSGALDPFIQGKIAMKIDGSWVIPGLLAYGRGLDLGVAAPPLPRHELARGRTTVTWNGGWAYAIPVTAKHPKAAWAFIRFITSERGYGLMMESSRADAEAQGHLFIPNQIPVKRLNDLFFTRYVYRNPRIPKSYRDGCRVYNDLLPVARYRPVTPVGQMLWNEHRNAMEAALYHHLPVREALDRGTAIVQREVDRFYAPVGGRPLVLRWFFLGYGLLIIVVAGGAYLWDTRRRGIEGSRGGYFRRQWRGGWVAASPWIIGFLIFGGGPMLFSLLISFCDYDILHTARFTGLRNYHLMFTEDALFPVSLWNTVYMVAGVPLGMAAGLAIALLLNLKIRGVEVWRTFFYLPAIVPLVASSMLWIWIFNPQGGLVNLALHRIGINGPLWLQDEHWAKPSLILMGLWGAGSGMIVWLAGLKGIDVQLYEAAAIDGAGAWQKFLYITIPQLTPYIFFNLVMGLIGTFQIFGQAFIMTQGGPVNSTLFYFYHLFNNAFRYGHMGYAAAMAWILFLIVLALTVVQLRTSKRWVHYEAG